MCLLSDLLRLFLLDASAAFPPRSILRIVLLNCIVFFGLQATPQQEVDSEEKLVVRSLL
jgi:hypothetical protein